MAASGDLSWLGDSFQKGDGSTVDLNYVKQAKIVIVLYTASWWGGCAPWGTKTKAFYEAINSTEKIVEVVVFAGDNDESGYNSTLAADKPWVGVPFADLGARKQAIGEKVPCTGYPTPGIVRVSNSEVLNADAYEWFKNNSFSPEKFKQAFCN